LAANNSPDVDDWGRALPGIVSIPVVVVRCCFFRKKIKEIIENSERGKKIAENVAEKGPA